MQSLEGEYRQAQICMNGHVITALYDISPGRRQDFCDRCGEKTIITCPNCESPIRGSYDAPRVVAINSYHPPAQCGDCGAPFPWTECRLAAARELASDLEQLSPEERGRLIDTLPDLVRDPMTQVSAGRFKRLAAKAGVEAGGAFRDILVDVASETAKKVIWGS